MTKEELKKEAEEYAKENISEYNNIGAKLYHAYLASAEPREKRIAELEKENAELKSIADFQTSSNMDRYFQLKRSKELLTKAKVLIKEALDKIDCVEHSSWWDKAEKFLAEE